MLGRWAGRRFSPGHLPCCLKDGLPCSTPSGLTTETCSGWPSLDGAPAAQTEVGEHEEGWTYVAPSLWSTLPRLFIC